ncbi:cell division protein ZapD [Brenneria goodwinii]|uniref:Cell division protein ZapD n=1 Tax=Brenneria goodwinii TaxID=1109412 RepID=A0A0G4JVL0_9GAMM|nr:cell division protein ZapD [Brenneria goodwinii]MCG8156230.1 cell division protein ZapD [Brenneria goodwinii]MCG8161031.1 cell division protein ZapD [Brenneria goodwinii]MCG8167496.1 cell division protein ZapD [Brenneria goodwinii]MCG8169868.1 cell division protein ZapD [Brenneria goodwinii]MCG8174888.1 cell division protein ZapD [Brenneria goodwinii]
MSDVSSTILFEHPLNEKMRTWLRIESLLQQLHHNHALIDMGSAMTFFRAIADMMDILERGDVRTELLKELERQQQKLLQWRDVPGVDMERIHSLRQQLKEQSSALMAAPRMGQVLREDRLIGMVRQRISIPGGCCSFDLPTLHIWLYQPQEQREQLVAGWLNSLSPLRDSLTMVLELIRHSATFRPQISLNGFFQDNASDADLLRLRIDLAHQLYPQISGHKTRYAIRFLALDSENGQIPPRLTFELACC